MLAVTRNAFRAHGLVERRRFVGCVTMQFLSLSSTAITASAINMVRPILFMVQKSVSSFYVQE
jgi:hypothetical protein